MWSEKTQLLLQKLEEVREYKVFVQRLKTDAPNWNKKEDQEKLAKTEKNFLEAERLLSEALKKSVAYDNSMAQK